MSEVDVRASRAPERPRRSALPHVLEVLRTEALSPSLTRVHLGGAGAHTYLAAADPDRLARTDSYAKLLFARPELGLVPPYDLDELRMRLPLDALPVRRTYTLSRKDLAAGELAIDFVIHGTEGIAGPWAASAQPGDLLCLSLPGGAFSPTTDAAVFRLYAGDESALPAIAAALAGAPEEARGIALIEVDGPGHEIPLAAPAGVEVRWVHRGGATPALVAAVETIDPFDGPVEAFVHGEREEVKSLRVLLQERWGIGRAHMSLSAYWARGRTEDRFQAEKREPIGQLFPDAGWILRTRRGSRPARRR